MPPPSSSGGCGGSAPASQRAIAGQRAFQPLPQAMRSRQSGQKVCPTRAAQAQHGTAGTPGGWAPSLQKEWDAERLQWVPIGTGAAVRDKQQAGQQEQQQQWEPRQEQQQQQGQWEQQQQQGQWEQGGGGSSSGRALNGSGPGNGSGGSGSDGAGSSKNDNGFSSSSGARFQSSWGAVEATGGRGGGNDYLHELGAGQQYNINVDHGQDVQFIDSLFVGNILGHKSDIADGSLRGYEMRTLAHLVGDYYVAPRFLDAVVMHVTKNTMADREAFGSRIRVPLILGVWGGKGMGKSFQTELALKKLGVEPVIMSAGELEHEWAGTPGRLIRERYRKASEIGKVRGKMSALVINDIDAGIGHMGNTQVTVNNQIVVATLMNLCDHPNSVSIGGDWLADEHIPRVPIIVTGNDLSTIFAPLLRDGRMEKFYWEPSREDLANILWQMYRDDGLALNDMHALLDTFPGQPLDFFGAIRAAMYDGQIRDWIRHDVMQGQRVDQDSNMDELGRRLLDKEGLPDFGPLTVQLPALVAEGRRLAAQQDAVNSIRLAPEYLKKSGKGGSLIGLKG